ncbi:MAG: hypothetical protein FDX02_05805 [Chlorobium sp.]|nr:MAG: hypothetical protein FDX02_05805 [Chlorobium sp.]
MKNSSASLFTGLLPGLLFVCIALYLLFFYDTASAAARDDLRQYAMLTGAYGIWRIIRFSMAQRELYRYNNTNI